MSQSKFEDALLAQARADRPSPAARRAAKAAFLASATIATGAATTSTAAAATIKTVGAGAASTAAPTLTTPVLVKLAIAIAVGSGGVAGVVAVRSNAQPVASPAPEVRVVPTSPRPALPASVTMPASAEVPVASPEELPTPITITPPKPKPAKAAYVEDALVTEARLLETARTCLAQSDFACTEKRLAEHAKRFGARGALAEEASILGIDAAKKSGNAKLLRARASAFLSEHPTSSYVPRVRAALESSDREENDR